MFLFKDLEVLEGFKKLREACRKKIHLVAPLTDLMVPSYDQKTKKIKNHKIDDYFHVGV